VAARGRGLNLTCLGFGGNCHLDPLVARVIRDLPADYLSMKVGINIYGAASLSERTFAPGIIAFVQIVRERHPTAPFVVISPIISPPREAEPNRVGFTLAAMREEVAGAVETLRAHGDRNVYYVDGLSLFGPGLVSLLPDDLHPNAEGYQALGENFLREVAARYFV
jgi:lysophospholipase L1-like esterase